MRLVRFADRLVRRFLRNALIVALVGGGSNVALAQELTPPRVEVGDVEYPDGARGEGVVVLDLLVDVDGAVRDVRTIAGAEPFLSVARSAAARAKGAPAKRGGTPVAARFRVEIAFRPPARTPAPPREHPPVPQAAPPDVEEVRVHGTRHTIGATAMTHDEVNAVPGAFGDAFRAIESFPGVTPVESGLPFFFVRGAPPGDNAYFVDGVRVPLLFHSLIGPSVLQPGLIDRVEFCPGGCPAIYGRAAGAVIEGRLRPEAKRFTGEANVRLFDAGALAESPFGDGRGDALVGGRIGYPEILKLFAPDLNLVYGDYQARVGWRLDAANAVSVFAFGAFDELDRTGAFEPLYRTMFHRADVRWDHAVSGGTLRTAVTFGADDSSMGNGLVSQHVVAETLDVRTALERKISRDVRLRLGADAGASHYDYALEAPKYVASSITATPRMDTTLGVYADASWTVVPRLELVLGLRADVVTSRPLGRPPTMPNSPYLAPFEEYVNLVTGDRSVVAAAMDPRLALRLVVSPRLTYVATLAVAHQPPTFVGPVPMPGTELGTLAEGLETAVQASQGVEVRLPFDIELRTSVFLHRYYNMNSGLDTCPFDVFGPGKFSLQPCMASRTNGRSFGAEVLLRRSFSRRIGGWLAYTFSHSTIAFPGSNEQVPSSYDHPHLLTAALTFDFGHGWHAGGRLTYYTGLPYTLHPATSHFNDARAPDYVRLDLRAEKRFRLGARGTISATAEFLNATLDKEATGTLCVYGTCSPQYIGPVTVPSVGIEAAY